MSTSTLQKETSQVHQEVLAANEAYASSFGEKATLLAAK